MVEVLKFVFSGFWHFVGFLLLFTIFCGCITQLSIVKITNNYPKEKEEPKKKDNVSELRKM